MEPTGATLESKFKREPAGIVLYLGHSEIPLQMPTPVVPLLHLNRRHSGLPGNLLTLQNSKSMAQLVRQLYSEGYWKFALLGWHVNPNAAAEREQGFREGMGKVRLNVREKLICTSQDSAEDFFDSFRHPTKSPDAVCCLNALCAGDLLCELKRRGIPYDGLRISGFDCSPMTAFFPRPILTVRLPLAELGRRAARLLIRRIENPCLSPIHEKLESEQIKTEPMGFFNHLNQ